jgi:hypothetical protein
MKFNVTKKPTFFASDASEHTSREAAELHEVGLICGRIAKCGESDLHLAWQGNPDHAQLRADILAFASLLRPPRAKRKDQSEAVPTASSAEKAESPIVVSDSVASEASASVTRATDQPTEAGISEVPATAPSGSTPTGPVEAQPERSHRRGRARESVA